MMRIPPAADAAHSHQFVDGKAKQRLACTLSLGQTAHRLDPANDLLDALAHLQTGLVVLVTLNAAVHSKVLVLDRHVRGDFELSAALEESFAVVILVCTERGPLVFVASALEHRPRRFALGVAAGVGSVDIHDQPIADPHEDLHHLAKGGLVALVLLEQAAIGVRDAEVCVAAALLPFEVHLWVTPAWRAAFIVPALDALVRDPGIDERAVLAEMSVAGRPAPLRAEIEAIEEGSGKTFVEQAIAVGAEGGVVRDLVSDVQTHEPAEQPVLADRFDQLALAADGEQNRQQEGLEQPLRNHQGAIQAGINRLKVVIHRCQQCIDHGAPLAQWVYLWCALFEADVAKHRPP